MFSLIRAWINGWINNGEAGDLRRNRVHFDVTVMLVAYYESLYVHFSKLFVFYAWVFQPYKSGDIL